MREEDISSRFQFGLKIARSAGSQIKAGLPRRAHLTIRNKGPHDLVTEVDLKVETLIRSEVTRAFPRDSILAEESGGQHDGEILWIVDPLDGTTNFVKGIQFCAVTLALLYNGLPLFGIVFDPFHDELFSAVVGRGARCNTERIASSTVPDSRQAIVGYSRSSNQSDESHLNIHTQFCRRGYTLRDFGSGALALAYVAAGRLDAHIETHMEPWDAAAGLLLVAEAGGRTSNYFGSRRATAGPAIGCSASLYTELCEMLRDA